MGTSKRLFGRRNEARGFTGSEDQRREDIAKLAYRLYEERGGEAGHELDDWLKAEALVKEGKTASIR